jgi:signal transduction histidine kinase
MSTINARLFLMMALMTSICGGLLFESYDGFLRSRVLRSRLDQSYQLMDEIHTLSDVRNRADKIARLKVYRSQLVPKTRMDELSNLIQSYADQNQALFYSRMNAFVKNEREYQRFTRNDLTFIEQRLTYLGAWLIVSMLLGFLFIHAFLKSTVVRRLHDLSRKMEDFLQDKYTYQFSVPSPDEIGHVQATFNSLAQRVLMNVEELKSLDQAKSDFLSIASHELRTPLTSIKGSLSLLHSGVVGKMNEMADNLLVIAETETDRLIRLINDVLDLAKIEARKLPLSLNWHSFPALIETTLQSLQGLASQMKVELVVTSVPKVEVNMDKDRVHQVLTNLLSNALKYSPKGAPVVVHCDLTPNNELLIEIRDSGRGIDPQDQELIFQKFRQVTNPKNPLVKGTGLGLAIAKAVVEEHGGQIGVKSQPGQGSVFYFTLPQWRFEKIEKQELAA